MRRLSLGASLLVFAFALVPLAAAGGGLGPDAIFSRAKLVWRTQSEAPFVHLEMRERYVWRDRLHDNWWQVWYRGSDGALALRRTIVAEQENARLRGTPIRIDLRFHNGLAKADTLDTNADADAFPILDPQIAPDSAFGLAPARFVDSQWPGEQYTAPKVALVGTETASPTAAPTPTPIATAAPSPLQTPLRELVRVEAISHDYHIELAGTERLNDTDVYHLTLTPLRDPRVYRLRDLWIDSTTFATLQIALDGLFDGEPYDDARWLVTYIDLDGHRYIQQIRTDDQLRFGMDRFVSGLQFDFVQYDFPPDVPEMMFERYL
jgi:hypothetical protein